MDYLSTHFYDEQMANDIIIGMNTLSSHLTNSTQTINILNHSKDFLSMFPLQQSPNERIIQTMETLKNSLRTCICSFVCESLLSELKNTTYIDKEIAMPILHLWDSMPHTTTEIFQLIYNVCNRSCLSAPLEAFEYTIKLLEEQPALLSGSDASHPNYKYYPSEQRTFDRCIICGGTGTPYHRAFSYKIANFDYPHLPVKLWMKCNDCGNLYTWKHPEEHLALSEHSELILPDKSKYLTTLGTGTGMSFSIWADILKQVRTYSKGNTLLEVGVGTGDLLATALELQYNVDAVEIVPSSAQRVANMLDIPVHNCDFLQYQSSKKYDIIIMGDVIEHIINPKQALLKVKELLNENGALWLSTPNYESAFSRMHKLDDAMWRVCNHLTYFSYQGFQVLAEKCGFIIQEYTISKRYNGSMELILTVKK